MRLLPKPWEGLHEAFPDPVEANMSSQFKAISQAGLVGIARFGFGVVASAISKKPLPWAATAQITAYSTVGLLGFDRIMYFMERHAATEFLHSRGIQIPRQQLADRLTSFDLDNVYIGAGLAGVLLTSRLRQPWAISGWKRNVAAFSLGATGGFTIKVFHAVLTASPEERRRFNERVRNNRMQRMKWSSFVWHGAWTFKVTQPAEAPSFPAHAMKGTGSPIGGASGGSAQGSGAVIIGSGPGVEVTDQIGRDGPHLTTTVPDETEPVPFANTNYDWTTDTPIQDLEKHIKFLQQRRHKLAQEAEFVWAWLSEKEAEYYNSPTYDPKNKQETKEKYFLEFLGSHHTKTWLEVTSCDWMLQDARKRIEQLKSKDANGTVTWQAGCSEAAAKTEPKFALRLVRDFEQAMLTMQNQLEQVKAQTSVDMADPSSDFDTAANEQVYNPVKKKMTTQKEMMIDISDQINKALEQTTLMKEAASEIIADGEERVRAGSPTKKR